jgi:hypothetical protein
MMNSPYLTSEFAIFTPILSITPTTFLKTGVYKNIRGFDTQE